MFAHRLFLRALDTRVKEAPEAHIWHEPIEVNGALLPVCPQNSFQEF
jgi:hypothetical protein